MSLRRYYEVRRFVKGQSVATYLGSALTADAAVDLYLEDPENTYLIDQHTQRRVDDETLAQVIANRKAER